MSSRGDHRRRDRSWERDDKDRDRDRYARSGRGGPGASGRRRPSRSRSRSPPRRGDRDHRDRRDPVKDREDSRRDREKKDHRRDYGRERERERDDRRDADSNRERDSKQNRAPRPRETDAKFDKEHSGSKVTIEQPSRQDLSTPVHSTHKRPDLDPDVTAKGVEEEGEAMEATNDSDAEMMALMGMTGFGTTKGKPVEGNQEGAVDVKKMRTWRQYMNRRGGFNRPLDKIK